MKTCIPIGQPLRVLADPTHRDYYKYVLENGTTDPKTFRSFYNQPDMTEFSHSLLRHAPYSFNHPLKQTEEIFKYDSRTGVAYMDVSDRNDILALKGLRKTIEEEYEDIIKVKDTEEFQNVIEQKRLEIERRFENINIPNKEEVKNKILQEFIVDNFKGELNRGNRDLVSRVRSMTSGDINKSKELLASLTRRQVVEEEQARRQRIPDYVGDFGESETQYTSSMMSEIPAPVRPDGTVLQGETDVYRSRDRRTGQPTNLVLEPSDELDYLNFDAVIPERERQLALKEMRLLPPKAFKMKKIKGKSRDVPKPQVLVGRAGAGAGSFEELPEGAGEETKGGEVQQIAMTTRQRGGRRGKITKPTKAEAFYGVPKGTPLTREQESLSKQAYRNLNKYDPTRTTITIEQVNKLPRTEKGNIRWSALKPKK
jgi:hypothetical protein